MKTEETKKMDEQEMTDAKPAENGNDKPNETAKKGFWANLGKGAKIAIGIVGGMILTGAALVVTSLLGGKDEEETTETQATTAE